ncbi:hypothetical protein [uncultured Endozoicomonas sp.]|uniref:phosphorylase family protein n=1 Tax=uncultured Endozoicomonas sp. TaxID=432652 RepID=UPI00260CBD42|nr:hypothetical protein [uncultured Endozoicomonas sp.]
MKKTLIIMAMEAEARPVIEKLGLKPVADQQNLNGGFPRYRGGFNDHAIMLSLNGKCPVHQVDRIGTEYAALNTQSAILAFQPSLIINAGTCGAFARDANIADIITSNQPVVYHDHRVALEGFDRFAEGHYPTAYHPEYFAGIPHKLGVVTTGNSLDMPEIDEQRIIANKGMAKEMECAAIASVAALYDIEFLPIKSVTDHIDVEVDNAEQFLQNLQQASQRLSEVLPAVLNNIQ